MLVLLLLFQLQILPHSHPDKLPVDAATWGKCCHEQHCHETPMLAVNIAGRYWKISVPGAEPFIIESLAQPQSWGPWVEPSKNGKSYLCFNHEVSEIPSAENFICAFPTWQGFN